MQNEWLRQGNALTPVKNLKLFTQEGTAVVLGGFSAGQSCPDAGEGMEQSAKPLLGELGGPTTRRKAAGEKFF